MSSSGDGSRDSNKRTLPNSPSQEGDSGRRQLNTTTPPRPSGPSHPPTSGTSANPPLIMFPQWPSFGLRQQVNYPMGYGIAPSAFKPVQQGGTSVGAGGSGTKRVPEGPGEGSASDPKRQQVVAAAGGDQNVPNNPPVRPLFRCTVCGAAFDVRHALFGHMRCHKDRPWRGAFPPPTFSTDEFEGLPIVGEGGVLQGAEAQAVVADQTVEAAPPAGRESVGASTSGLEMEGGRGEGSSAQRGRDSTGRVWDRDLNKSPPPDSDEEEK